MLIFDGGLALIAFAVWIFCIIDVITTPESECRNLPKIVWIFLVIILFDVGSIVWLVAGRNWAGSANSRLPYKGNTGREAASRHPSNDRPGRRLPQNPDDDEEFLAKLRARAEEQRRRARGAEPSSEDEPPTPAP